MHNQAMTARKRATILLLLSLGMVAAACTSVRVLEDWPRELPPQEYFVRAWQEDTANQPLQELEDYLGWVVRFYQGGPGVMGWSDMTEALAGGNGEARRERFEQRRRELGRQIAAEWAKHNNVRQINTRMLSLWGNVMVTDPDPDYRMAAMQKIGQDVQALLDGELTPAQITESRYDGLDS